MENKKEWIHWILAVVFFLFAAAIVVVVEFNHQPRVRKYDCGMAEWHPDIPKEVKEECRKVRVNVTKTT